MPTEEQDTEKKELVKRERPLAKHGFTFLPTTWTELYSYAKEIAATDFVPKSMQGKPGAVLAAWQKGQEVGLPPMSALENIAIINGRPSIHSNGYWSLITSHPLCEWFTETPPDVALKQGYGECSIKRKGNPHVIVRRFSLEEAKTAGLLGKDNWKNYPGDMLQNRARHRAGDDAIPEAAQGLLPSDVAQDLEPRDVTPAKEEPLQIPQPREEAKAQEPKEPADDGGGAKEASPKERAKQPADKPEIQQTPETRKAEALAWIEFSDDETFLDGGKTWLNAALKGLSQNEQLEVCRAFNDRNKKIQEELKSASHDDTDRSN